MPRVKRLKTTQRIKNKMNFNTNQNKYDNVVPPAKYFNEEQEAAAKIKRGITLKSLGVMFASFVGVFALTFTAVTWPMVPQQASYLVKNFFENNDQQAYASLKKVVFDETTDSDGDGFTDIEELEAGYDPYDANPTKLDSDGDGIKDEVEQSFYGTDPFNPDTDNDGYNDLNEIVNGFSPLQPADFDKWVEARTNATLIIPSIDLELPVVWNEDLDNILEDLEKGVVKYNGTANPGEGNTAIVAHSSDYVWNDNKYASAFALIDRVKEGDPIYVDYAGTRYVYAAEYQKVTDPHDTSFFAQTAENSLTLGTCWPIGFSWNRLYLRASLIKTEAIK